MQTQEFSRTLREIFFEHFKPKFFVKPHTFSENPKNFKIANIKNVLFSTVRQYQSAGKRLLTVDPRFFCRSQPAQDEWDVSNNSPGSIRLTLG